MKIKDIIEKAETSYIQYRSDCENIAQEAQKHISWDDDIGCECFPGDGVCLTTTSAHMCTASLFFDVIKEKGDIDEEDFIRICI